MAGTTQKMVKNSTLPSSFLMDDSEGEWYWLALGRTREELKQVKAEVQGMEPFEGKAFPLYFGRVLVVQKVGTSVVFFNRSEALQAEHDRMLHKSRRLA